MISVAKTVKRDGLILFALTLVVLAMFVPSAAKLNEMRRINQIEDRLGQIVRISKAYLEQTGAQKVAYADILEQGLTSLKEPIAGESYTDIVVVRGAGVVTVKTSIGQEVSYRYSQ